LPAENPVGNRPKRDQQAPRPHQATATVPASRSCSCSQAVLQFLATTDVGRTSGPPAVEDNEDAASEASEWEAREQEERAWERREEEEVLGRE